MRTTLTIVAVLALVVLTTGCAAYRIAAAGERFGGQVVTLLGEKMIVTRSAAGAKVTMTDPTVKCQMFLVNGVEMLIEFKGFDLSVNIEGSGEGEDVALTPETIAMLRAQGLGDDAIESLLAAIKASVSSAAVEAPQAGPILRDRAGR